MSPIRVVESHRDDFEDPIAEMWEDDVYVGAVYWDGDTVAVQIYPDDEGDGPVIYDAADIVEAIVTAIPIVVPDDEEYDLDVPGLRAGGDGGEAGPVDPVDRFAEAFDPHAVHRSPGYEGYYPKAVVLRMIRTADELDLAVTHVEGMRLAPGTEPEPITGLKADLAGAHDDGSAWATFRASCNVQAEAVVERWPEQRDIAIALELTDRDGETYVA